MTHRSTGLWILVASILVGVTAQASSQINVRDFGAVGDGRTDDTEAIRQAFAESLLSTNMQLYPGTAYWQILRPVVFPHGHYLVSEPIGITNTTIRGEGAVIEQTSPDKPLFQISAAWRMRISGLTFLGGKHHLLLHNDNIDTGQIVISDCRFYGSSDASVDIAVQSTMTTIRDCIWVHCMQAVRHRGDQLMLSDSWINTHIAMEDKAAIEQRAGRMTVDNVCGVPFVSGSDQRWIDNGESSEWLTCKQTRFGGEWGGFTPVVNHAPLRGPWLGTMLLIEDSLICSLGNARRKCAVHCEKVPNSLVVRDCNVYVPEVLAGPDLAPEETLHGWQGSRLHFDVRDNMNALRPPLPEWVTLGEPRWGGEKPEGEKGG